MKRSTFISLLFVFILGISLSQYLTPLHLLALLDILQRLYYMAAFWFGLRGGVISSIVVSIMYAPHILRLKLALPRNIYVQPFTIFWVAHFQCATE